jgi:hypothetical protein
VVVVIAIIVVNRNIMAAVEQLNDSTDMRNTAVILVVVVLVVVVGLGLVVVLVNRVVIV